jgi:NADH-quinone oxidoreductase subunit M
VGAFKANYLWAAFAVSGIVLGAAYMLWLYQRTMFGALENPKNAALQDLSPREMTTLVPIVIMCFWIGLYPSPFLNRMEASVNFILARIHNEQPVAAQPVLSPERSRRVEGAAPVAQSQPLAALQGEPSR